MPVTPDEHQTLCAVAARIVPRTDRDAADGMVALPYLLRELAPGGAASDFLPTLRDLLQHFAARGFGSLSAAAQDACLASAVSGTTGARLVELVTEGFYTAPDGMRMVGFVPVTAGAR